MKYYPKSQIKTGLHTKGNEFIVSQTGLPYKGDYWGVSTGEFFSGKGPESNPSFRLSPVSSINKNTLKVENSSIKEDSTSYYIPDETYNNIKNIPLNQQAPRYPKQYVSSPNENDFKNGYMMKYFLKKSNEYKYIETSQSEYSLYISKSSVVPNELFVPLSMKWELNKDNLYNVAYIENIMGWYGFIKYFNGKF